MNEPPDTVTITTEQFTEGVRQAAQEVAYVHRRRLIVSGIVSGFLVAALVALPLVYFTGRSNCEAIGSLAAVAHARLNEERAGSRRFLRESKDRLGLSASGFARLIRETEERQEREATATRHVANRDCAVL